MDFLGHFRREVHRDDPAPERLALYVAGMAYPMLKIEEELQRIEEITALVRRALLGMEPGYERAMRFLDVLYYDLVFVGNRTNYYEPTNSFLNVVLERRVGLPIMLSLLYIAVGKRLNLDVSGMGFPGHFMVRYRDRVGTWILDPFNGKLVASDEVNRYLSDLFEQPIQLPPESFIPVTVPALVQRILNNLRNIYLGNHAFNMVLRVTDYQLAIDPSDPNTWEERGLLFYQENHWEEASYNLRRYFYLAGHLMTVYGFQTGEDDHLSERLPPHDEQLLEIYYQTEEMRKRIN